MNTLNTLGQQVEALAKEYGIDENSIVIGDGATNWSWEMLHEACAENCEPGEVGFEDIESFEQFCDEAEVGQVSYYNGHLQVFINKTTDGTEHCDAIEPHGGAYVYSDVSGNFLIYADEVKTARSPEQFYVDNLGAPEEGKTAEEVFAEAKENPDPECILGYVYIQTTKELIELSETYGLSTEYAD